MAMIFGVLPFLILMGLAMSPRMDTLLPGWIDIVGGRQSARTLHFLAASLMVLFVFVHVFEVIISGLWNNVRSMITGRYEVEDRERRSSQFCDPSSGGLSTIALAGCDAITNSQWGSKVLRAGEGANRRAQRALSPKAALAQEFSEADLSPTFAAMARQIRAMRPIRVWRKTNFGIGC